MSFFCMEQVLLCDSLRDPFSGMAVEVGVPVFPPATSCQRPPEMTDLSFIQLA